MMKWKLKDLTKDGKGSYGIGAPAVPYNECLPTYLRITDINDDGSINFSDLKSVDDSDSDKYLLKENDIVFARTGNSTGRSYFYEKQHGAFVYAGFLIKFSLDPTKVNPRMLKYYTHSKEYYDWVHSFDTGGTRGNINAKTYGDMLIELPERSKQDKIVSILSSLDRKIELNNKINAQLEEMAQAIFKSWFVDSKKNTLQRLSELTCNITDGVHNSVQDEKDSGYYLLSCKNIIGGKLTISTNERTISKETFLKLRKRTKLEKCDILVSTVGTVGEILILNDEPDNLEFQRSVGIIKTNSQIVSPYYIYFALKHNQKELKHSAHGAVQQCIFISDLKDFEIQVGEQEERKQFDLLVKPIMNKISSNNKQNLHLSHLRDTLLPKLMSGEIEIQ